MIHLDTLGRPFLSVAHNVTGTGTSRVHEFYRTRTELDIQGNTLAIYDARQHETDDSSDDLKGAPYVPYATIAQRFDVLGRRLRVDSPDAGSRLTVQDAAGKPLRQWDSRGQTMRWQYDELQRPTHLYVAKGTNEPLVQRTVYGEALDFEPEDPAPPIPRSQERNLRGQVYQVYDCAGLMTSEEFDFKGNLLRAVRRLADEYDEDPDWSDGELETVPSEIEQDVSGLLQTEEFATERTYDALNRVVTQTSPTTGNPATDASVTRHVYNEAGLLDAVYVSVRGAPEEAVVGNIEYNARGQRLSCAHAATGGTPSHGIAYTYDPETFRLTRLVTTRASDGAKLQDLRYTYDSSGNITEKRDTANWDADLSGALGGGGGTYVYDALYRLTEATGREHAGQQPTAEDPPHGSVPHGNDLGGLREYVERLTYDEVGNILEMRHLTGPQNSQSWSRRYDYVPETNRLRATSLHSDSPGQFSATYAYDAHGSMTEMPHLLLSWDYADRLRHTERTGGGGQLAYFTYDASGQRVRKVSVHNGVFEERIYLGDFEVFRRRSIDGSGNLGALELERETLHVMDGERRVAMVETKTVDTTDPAAEGVSRWRYQLADHLGSSAMEVDENANVISYEEYHPYGSTAFHLFSGSEVSAKRYRYTGKERDEETDLYYHGARYYAPWLGRWTAADPLGVAEPGRPDLNLYGYVAGAVFKFVDPTGTYEVPAEVNPRRGQAVVEATARLPHMKEVLKGVRVTRGSGFEIKRQDGGLVTVEWRSGRSSAHLGDSVLVGTGDRSDYFKVAGLYHELIHEQLHTGAGDEELLAEWKTFQSNVAGNLDMRALAQDIASSFEYDLAGRASRSREDKARVVEDVERWLVHEVFTYEKEAAVELAGQSLLRWHGKGDAQSAARKDVQALLRRVGVDRSRDTSFSLSGRTEKRIAQAVERVSAAHPRNLRRGRRPSSSGFGEAFASTGAERTWVLEHRSAAETKPKPEIGGRPGPLRYRRWSAAGKVSPLPDMGTVLPVSERVRMQPQRSTYIRAKGEG